MIGIYRGHKGALKLIHDIACDYDRSEETYEGMKKLVDEILSIAVDALNKGDKLDGLQ